MKPSEDITIDELANKWLKDAIDNPGKRTYYMERFRELNEWIASSNVKVQGFYDPNNDKYDYRLIIGGKDER